MQLIKIKQHSSHKPHDVHLKKISSLALVCFLLLQLSSTLVDGQLEAVGAVLSVVPVTSILATAGLVGVKLAALSRLLQVLGYDQAYLASADGTGTAAQPIGLQSHYSYMFPYGPGVNISVKEDHDRYQGSRLTPAKTYPAMGLPGDYELEHNPFRGSEMLKDIFRNAGLNAPIHQQQYQVKGKNQHITQPSRLSSPTTYYANNLADNRRPQLAPVAAIIPVRVQNNNQNGHPIQTPPFQGSTISNQPNTNFSPTNFANNAFNRIEPTPQPQSQPSPQPSMSPSQPAPVPIVDLELQQATSDHRPPISSPSPSRLEQPDRSPDSRMESNSQQQVNGAPIPQNRPIDANTLPFELPLPTSPRPSASTLVPPVPTLPPPVPRIDPIPQNEAIMRQGVHEPFPSGTLIDLSQRKPARPSAPNTQTNNIPNQAGLEPSSNLAPVPFAAELTNPTFEHGSDEFVGLVIGRRRKRSVADKANPAPAHHGAFVPARSSLVQKLPAAEPPMSPGDRSSAQELPKQPETRADNGAFGMPAMNIQQLRRRRSVRRKIMSSVHDLPPLGKANSNRWLEWQLLVVWRWKWRKIWKSWKIAPILSEPFGEMVKTEFTVNSSASIEIQCNRLCCAISRVENISCKWWWGN